MGLIKLKENVKNLGYTGDYWHVDETNVSWKNNKANISVHLYKDKTTRVNGGRPLMTVYYDFGYKADRPFIFDLDRNIKTDMYDYLMTLPEFEGAVKDEDHII